MLTPTERATTTVTQAVEPAETSVPETAASTAAAATQAAGAAASSATAATSSAPAPVTTPIAPAPALPLSPMPASRRSAIVVEPFNGSAADAPRPHAVRADQGLVATLYPPPATIPQAPTAAGHDARATAARTTATSSPAAPAVRGVAVATAEAAAGMASPA